MIRSNEIKASLTITLHILLRVLKTKSLHWYAQKVIGYSSFRLVQVLRAVKWLFEYLYFNHLSLQIGKKQLDHFCSNLGKLP